MGEAEKLSQPKEDAMVTLALINATVTNMGQVGGSCLHAFSIARPGTVPPGTANEMVEWHRPQRTSTAIPPLTAVWVVSASGA